MNSKSIQMVMTNKRVDAVRRGVLIVRRIVTEQTCRQPHQPSSVGAETHPSARASPLDIPCLPVVVSAKACCSHAASLVTAHQVSSESCVKRDSVKRDIVRGLVTF